MVHIKLSYEHPEDVRMIKKLLRGHIVRMNEPKNQKGRFRKVYIDLRSIHKKGLKNLGDSDKIKDRKQNIEVPQHQDKLG